MSPLAILLVVADDHSWLGGRPFLLSAVAVHIWILFLLFVSADHPTLLCFYDVSPRERALLAMGMCS